MTRPTLLPLRRPRARRLAAVPAAVAAVAAPVAAAPTADAAPVRAAAPRRRGGTTLYVVQRGDTLTSVAARTGTDVATLVRLNRLTHPDQLVAGDAPRRPRARHAAAHPCRRRRRARCSYTVPARRQPVGDRAAQRVHGRRHRRRERPPGERPHHARSGAAAARRRHPRAPRPPRPKPSTPVAVHVVAAGETLSGIAERYHLGLSVLLRANRLGADAVIRPGQKLVLPGVPVTTAPRPAPAPTHGYVVRRGDTLSGIAVAARHPADHPDRAQPPRRLRRDRPRAAPAAARARAHAARHDTDARDRRGGGRRPDRPRGGRREPRRPRRAAPRRRPPACAS